MKNLKLFYYPLVLILAVSSCSKRPEAIIYTDRVIAAVNETINATSTGINTNAYTWAVWEGYDIIGSSSNHAVTVHGGQHCDNSWSFKIDSAGTYTLWLKACYYKDGCDAEETFGFCEEATLVLTIQ